MPQRSSRAGPSDPCFFCWSRESAPFGSPTVRRLRPRRLWSVCLIRSVRIHGPPRLRIEILTPEVLPYRIARRRHRTPVPPAWSNSRAARFSLWLDGASPTDQAYSLDRNEQSTAEAVVSIRLEASRIQRRLQVPPAPQRRGHWLADGRGFPAADLRAARRPAIAADSSDVPKVHGVRADRLARRQRHH